MDTDGSREKPERAVPVSGGLPRALGNEILKKISRD